MRNFLNWLPWVGVIVVVGVVGGVLGVTGAVGRPTVTRSVIGSDASIVNGAPGYDCPGGALVTSLQAHDRVLAIERSDDSSYIGVRDPLNVSREVWVSAGVLSVNANQPAIATLPVGSCPSATGILMPPTSHGDTTPVAPTEPTKPSTPTKPPVRDTTAPKLGTPTAGTPVVCIRIGDPPYTDTIRVTASDNVGVTSIAISWSGATTGSRAMKRSGSSWVYVYDVGSSTATGTVTFQLRARDAAGNLSSPNKVSITQEGCVG